jgi:hypothetical protein
MIYLNPKTHQRLRLALPEKRGYREALPLPPCKAAHPRDPHTRDRIPARYLWPVDNYSTARSHRRQFK